MKYILSMIFLLFNISLCQADVVSVTVHTATLWSQPGGKYAFETLKAPRHYPLSVLESRSGYLKVRDYNGQIGWVTTDQVGPQRGVVVEVARVNIRKGPGKNYPILFKAFKGVTFRVLAEQKGWLHVKHENGDKGWVVKSSTWGQ